MSCNLKIWEIMYGFEIMMKIIGQTTDYGLLEKLD